MDIRPAAWKWIIGSAVALLSCAAGLAFTPQGAGGPAELVHERVFLAGVPVGGMSREEAQQVADELAARLLATPIVLRHGKATEKTSPAQLKAATDPQAAVDELFRLNGEERGLLDRLRDRILGPDPEDVPLPVTLAPEAVERGLMRFSIRIGAEPKNARLTRVDGKFKAEPPRPGQELDVPAVTAALQAALDDPAYRASLAASLQEEPSRGEWQRQQAALEIQAVLREATPRITMEHLKPITAEIASFSTSLGGSSRDRTHNIQIAARAIDGTVLLPGDTFSYNDVVGPRVPKAGYRNAPVVVRGELQDGIAGGICQVSSTLYNAALLADMQIVRRRPHAIPVSYLPPGRDATVVDGAVDFRFKNRLKHPVALDVKVVGRQMVTRIYGHPSDRRQVEIVSGPVTRVPSEAKVVRDPNLPKGKRVVEKAPKDGRRVTITRVVKQDGKVIRQETVSRDYYRPFPGVIREGTRESQPEEGEAVRQSSRAGDEG